MMRAAVILAALVAPAAAQEQAPGTTLLHLSAMASVSAAPDVLVAALTAQNTTSSPATAQRRVNTLIAEAMKTVAGVAGVEAKATGYEVDPVDDKHTSWTAQQTLDLRSTDGPALLDLVGTLQAHGLVTASLDWELSPTKRQQAYDAATAAALKAMQDRADAAAKALGLQVDHLRDVRLDDSGAVPRPVMGLKAMAMPAPQATAANQDVTASVSADIVLRK